MRNLALVWVLAGVAVALLAAGDGKPSVSTFTDKRDGKVYKIVKIGSQVWFAENLNYAVEESRCYEDSPDSCAKYGRLYDWNTAMTACPAGTHLPTNEEWATLVDYAGGEKWAGKKLQATSGWVINREVINVWSTNEYNGTDDYGFSALPGGDGSNCINGCCGSFYSSGNIGNWWSATERDAYSAFFWDMGYGVEKVGRGNTKKTILFSVRCVLYDEKERRK
jgi:uncharacterized protein (TIGR02145 family)